MTFNISSISSISNNVTYYLGLCTSFLVGGFVSGLTYQYIKDENTKSDYTYTDTRTNTNNETIKQIECNMIGDLPNIELTKSVMDNGLTSDILNVDRKQNICVNLDLDPTTLPKYCKTLLKIKYYNQYIYMVCSYKHNILFSHIFSTDLDGIKKRYNVSM